MAEHDRLRRAARGLGFAGLTGLAGLRSARAQTPGSTWDRIYAADEVRRGVAPGEPRFYKDLTTGEWGGIGVLAGQAVVHDPGVKLVTVEATWANQASTTGQTPAGYETDLKQRGIDPAQAAPVIRELWSRNP